MPNEKPGDVLKRFLEAREWTQTDLSEILGRPVRVVNEIIMGKRAISAETAQGLGNAFGNAPEYWLALESSYQLEKVRNGGEKVARRARLYSKIPIKELIRRNWITNSDDLDVLVRRVLTFLEIEELDQMPRPIAHAARRSQSERELTLAQDAWLRRVHHLGPAVSVSRPYSREVLPSLIRELRSLAANSEDTRYVPKLLADSGIRLLIVEPLPGTRIDGVCLWLGESAPIVALTLRYDRLDAFWFTLIHELAHVKGQHGLRGLPELDTDIVGEGASKDERSKNEQMADALAASTLIPPASLDDFIIRQRPMYSALRVEGFARTMNVHPGIVVGQLQHRGEIPYSVLRRFLVPVREYITAAALTDGWGSVLPATA